MLGQFLARDYKESSDAVAHQIALLIFTLGVNWMTPSW